MKEKSNKKTKILDKLPVNVPSDIEGREKTIGYYFSNLNEFRYNQRKSVNFDMRTQSWTLDEGVLNFLVSKKATVKLKDLENKWELECEAEQFKYYGKVVVPKEGRPLVHLDMQYWKVTKISNRSMIMKCSEYDCRYNFFSICTRGAITISSKGECEGFEDKN